MSNPHELLEQLKSNGLRPSEEIFRLRNLVAGAESRVAELEGQLRATVPQRITEDTPEGVLLWTGDKWEECKLDWANDWITTSDLEMVHPQPTSATA